MQFLRQEKLELREEDLREDGTAASLSWAVGVGLFQVFGCGTVDGQNPAPPRMMIIPLFIGLENHPRWCRILWYVGSTKI